MRVYLLLPPPPSPTLALYFLYCHLFIIGYQLSFYLWKNETVLKRSKDSKYYD